MQCGVFLPASAASLIRTYDSKILPVVRRVKLVVVRRWSRKVRGKCTYRRMLRESPTCVKVSGSFESSRPCTSRRYRPRSPVRANPSGSAVVRRSKRTRHHSCTLSELSIAVTCYSVGACRRSNISRSKGRSKASSSSNVHKHVTVRRSFLASNDLVNDRYH